MPTDRISSPEELRAALGEHGLEAAPDDDGLVVATGADASPVRLRTLDVDGVAWIEIACVIGPPRSISPQYVLTDNFRTTIGALGASGGLLGLRQTLPLDGVLAADVAAAIREIARAAAAWRRELEAKFR